MNGFLQFLKVDLLLRDIGPIGTMPPATPLPGTMAPATPLPWIPHRQRQESAQTLEEPQLEPLPEVSRMSSEQSQAEKRRKVEGGRPSSSRKELTEKEKLERAALKELRRLDREDKERAKEAAAAASSSSSAARPAVSSQLEDIMQAEEQNQDVGPIEIDDEELLSYVSISVENDSLMATQVKSRNSEFNMKDADATPEDRIGFRESDLSEWKAIMDMGAVKVLTGKESARVQQQYPHRIVASRMIRRKKPTPGVGNFKFKSRWCVHGHKDPDSQQLQTYSLIPSTEAISMFFQICVNLSMEVSLADVSNAFCQADKLDRPAGKLYVRR